MGGGGGGQNCPLCIDFPGHLLTDATEKKDNTFGVAAGGGAGWGWGGGVDGRGWN